MFLSEFYFSFFSDPFGAFYRQTEIVGALDTKKNIKVNLLKDMSDGKFCALHIASVQEINVPNEYLYDSNCVKKPRFDFRTVTVENRLCITVEETQTLTTNTTVDPIGYQVPRVSSLVV